jgi:molybdate transport system substrate-binding protein
MTRTVRILIGLVALVLAGCDAGAGAAAPEEPLLVAGAADLMPAFEELGERFEQETGEDVTFVFGSSGQLAQQIIEGAPMDVFASANVEYVEEVVAAGRGDASTQTTYAFGRITIWSRGDAWGGWSDLRDLAEDPGVTNLAIANPDHAPYGTAAREAFMTRGLWDELEGRLVFGENIADTQRLAASGNADAAVVALSLALAADQRDEGAWVLIDDALHEPLQQELVVVAEDPDRAELAARFVAFVDGEDGRAVMRRYGFLLPDERSPAAGDR